jgi:co-chaperonin GroES (HSP10)
MKAIGNNIIITPYNTNIEETKGGLLLTSKQREDIRYNKALVESVSDDIKGLNEGDIIYYDKHAGHGIEFEKKKFSVIKLQDVVVVL